MPATATKLALRPLSVQEANKVVGRWHRHNRPTVSGLFAVGCEADGEVVGVAIVGRPVARALQDGFTAEVTRLCVLPGLPAVAGGDGREHAHPACSMLYAACCRAAKALGYRRVYTYTLAEESGASLRAAGWTKDADLDPRPTWSCPSRHRVQTDLFGEQTRPPGAKVRWVRLLGTEAR